MDDDDGRRLAYREYWEENTFVRWETLNYVLDKGKMQVSRIFFRWY